MKPTQVMSVLFNVLVTAAAVKAALTTLSRPMGGQPATKAAYTPRGSRLGAVTVEGYDGDEDALDGLDYEDLL